MIRRTKTAILTVAAAAAIIGIIGLLAAGAVLAQEPAAPQPKIVVPELMHDFGNMPRGDKLQHDFVLRNEGAAPLEVREVRPACGCTVVEFDKTIAPGAEGKVRAVLDTHEFAGPIAKTIDVLSNDPETPRLQLTLKASVRPLVAVTPGYARYSFVQQEAPGTLTQYLWAQDGHDLKVLEVKSPYPYLKTTFREATAEERKPEGKGRQWRVDMTIAPDAAVGTLGDFVEIHTDHPKDKLVRIPVSGFVRPIIAVTPPVANIGTRDLSKEAYTGKLRVANYATETIAVTKVESDVPGVTAKLEPLEDGRTYNVLMTFSPATPKGDLQGTLRIHTASPKIPVVEVPLRGKVL
ncbi:MAG TPA: DUF1573 domain-containing protein [Thermoanaerobaculia bacterium]|nr:DUF1573 domain-containing protein [Thermoanaerobaculia bacterium]